MLTSRVARPLAVAFTLAAAPFASAHAQAAAGPAPIHSTVFFADSGRVRATATGGKQRSIVDTVTATLAKLEMHETTLAPGQAPHAGHRHLHEEMMIVRSGVMSVLLGEREFTAKPGDVVFAASNEFHGWKNGGTEPATYLIIRLDTPEIAAAARAAAKPAAKP
jgi:quercetin dioxygenase-like cupin family protein